MNAATWVALALGLGSLALTFVLDKRNRTERIALNEAERAERLTRERRETDERNRARWLEDRKSTYLAYLDAIEARESRLHMLLMGIIHGYDSSGDAGETTDSSIEARRLELLAPEPIAHRVMQIETLLKSAEWAAQIYCLELTENHRGSSGPRPDRAAQMGEEMQAITSQIDDLRAAMRDDLGVGPRESP